ncbi:PREDICTED: contactin-3-like [Nicrophorus vespilloides]|uniref:Contactin-3-like n=1 Tax=Nicrophorus vespilloides TaxID=110193 RepID=A0ABM1NB10_NICVS|nr:PREDICTED: contactin-3-like [Nicrophorus vespilloides]
MNKLAGLPLLLALIAALGISDARHSRRRGFLPESQYAKVQKDLIAELSRGGSRLHAGPNSIRSGPEISKLQNRLFLSPNYTLVEAQTRTTAALHCEVQDIGNCTVTWKRIKDYQILTFGLLTYSSDNRFFARNGKGSKDWSLHIRYVDKGDAGIYECQVSSHPPSSIFVELKLVEAHAEIVGGSDKIVKSGSPLLLTCVLQKSTEVPEYIFWYHGQRMINYDLGGGAAVRHGRHGSELLIPSAEIRHSGNYSCVPSNARPDSVNVHVLHSEKPAAMQHGSKSSQGASRSCPIVLLLALYSLLSSRT